MEADAKRFEATPGSLTLYVVRHRWADAVNQVPVSIDDRPVATTIPESVIRARLSPGEHRLAFEWEGRHSLITVTGKSGDVRFVQLVGSSWFWGSEYRWVTTEELDARHRALRSKLISDLDLLR